MKKLLTLALAVLLVSALAVIANANAGIGYSITASRGTPVVDGVKDDIWDTAEAQTQDRIRNGEDTGTHVTIRFLYDDENLYFLGEVPDASLWTKDLSLASMTYNMDGSEICLSLSNNSGSSIDAATDAWVGVTPYGDFYSSQANWLVGSGAGVSGDNETFDAEFMEIHTSLENDPDNDQANPYYVEAVWHIKAYDEQYAPKDGVAYGFEISYNDNAAYENRTMCIGWSDISDAASGNPSVWGEVVLGGAAEPADPNAPAILWDFNADGAMDANMGANSGANTLSWTPGADGSDEFYTFTASGSDPYVSVDLSAADVADVVWAKARVKNSGPATAIELFGHTDGRGLTGSECTHINVGTDGEWHTYIIYIPDENVATVNAYKDPQYAITEPYWAGTVDWIRLDPMWQEGDDGNDAGGSMNDGDSIMIDYIAFFSSEEAAKAFRSELDSEYVAPAEEAVEAPAEEPAAESKGFASLDEAAAAAGKTAVSAYTFVEGSNGFGGEGAENLWDGDTATKFCTNEFPVVSVVELDGVYTVNGFTMATANDNADYNGRNPNDWTISVSADGENWTELAKGDDTFFEETNFTYYNGDASAEGVSFVKFEAASSAANLFQVSELTLYGEKTAEKGAADEALDEKAEAPQTFDFGVIAAVAAVLSLGGFVVAKKKH